MFFSLFSAIRKQCNHVSFLFCSFAFTCPDFCNRLLFNHVASFLDYAVPPVTLMSRSPRHSSSTRRFHGLCGTTLGEAGSTALGKADMEAGSTALGEVGSTALGRRSSSLTCSLSSMVQLMALGLVL